MRSMPSPRPTPSTARIYDIPSATYGIVTAGKAHLDLMEALRLIGLDEAACRAHRHRHLQGRHGLAARPARRAGIRAGQARDPRGRGKARHHREPVQGILLRLSRLASRSAWSASTTRAGERLIPWTGELSPRFLAGVLARRLDAIFPDLGLAQRVAALTPDPERTIVVPGATRTPYFCSGCPHNTSTKVPEGSKALAGIGCHFMASWMDRETSSLIQMGGEGVNWAASSRFTGPGPHLPESRRRHLLSFRLHGDPAGHRSGRQHHLQDPVQRRGRHDGRPAGRRSGQRPCHRPQRAGGGRVAHRARLRSIRRSSSPPICRKA